MSFIIKLKKARNGAFCGFYRYIAVLSMKKRESPLHCAWNPLCFAVVLARNHIIALVCQVFNIFHVYVVLDMFNVSKKIRRAVPVKVPPVVAVLLIR